MRRPAGKRWLRWGAFTLVETMVGATIFTVVIAAVYMASTTLLSSMTASENYTVGQLQTMDYLSLDLRRATSYSFTTTNGVLTLPLNLTLPQYYQADGRTPNVPQRTLVTVSNHHDHKDHKVFSANYYYYYGTLGGTVALQYYLSNGSLYRKEGSLPARVIGTNISSVVFGPSAAAIDLDPVVTTTITFLPTKRAKKAPLPLSGSTFMRQYYYSDFN